MAVSEQHPDPKKKADSAQAMPEAVAAGDLPVVKDAPVAKEPPVAKDPPLAKGAPTDVAPGVSVASGALVFRFDRSGGPGGQNVNKVATQATLTVNVVDLAASMPVWAVAQLRAQAGHRLAQNPERLVLASSESRSQLANKKNCLDKLREMLVQAMDRPKPRKKRRVSKASKARRVAAKRHRGQVKQNRRSTGD